MKLELRIVDLLVKNTGKQLSINDIAKNLDEFYSLVHRTVDKLTKEGVIVRARAGKSFLCSLDRQNERTFALLELGEIEKRDEFLEKNKELKIVLEDFVSSVTSGEAKPLTIVLFGSYAKGSVSPGSDIDILVVAEKKLRAERVVREVYSKYGKEISPIVMAADDFRRQKDKPIIGEIVANHYVLYSAEGFVNLVLKP